MSILILFCDDTDYYHLNVFYNLTLIAWLILQWVWISNINGALGQNVKQRQWIQGGLRPVSEELYSSSRIKTQSPHIHERDRARLWLLEKLFCVAFTRWLL